MVKRNAPTIYNYQWAVIDTKENNKRIGKYKTEKLAKTACFNFNTYGPEAEQFLKEPWDRKVDITKINHTSTWDDLPLKPKRHSSKRLINLD